MSAISIKQLLEAGVHFGHQTGRWNPKMKEFIFGERNGIHIVDLQRTLRLFKEAIDFLYDLGVEGKEVLFVGTKRQAQEAIEEDAVRCGMHFVTNRWLGGLLTNFQTIQNSIKRYKQLETMKEDGSYKNFSKKEVAKLERERKKLDKNLRGIREMSKLPDSIFVIDTDREAIAVKEASRLGIPVIAVVDTNCNPDLIDYVIPGNDDALRSVKLFTSTVSDAIQAGRSVWDTRKEEERLAKEEAEKVEVVARAAREAARVARKAEAEKAAAEKAAAEKAEAKKAAAEKAAAKKVGPEEAEVKKGEAPAAAEENISETAPVAVEEVKPKAEKAPEKAETKEVAEEPAKVEKDAAAPEDVATEADLVEEKPKVEASKEQPEPKAEGAEESEGAAIPAKKAEEKTPARKRTVKVEAEQATEETVEETATPAKAAEAAAPAEAVKSEKESKTESTTPPNKKVAKKAAPRKSTTKKASTTKAKATAAKKSPAEKKASSDAEKPVEEKSSATADDAPK